jgi:hypothetical protein
LEGLGFDGFIAYRLSQIRESGIAFSGIVQERFRSSE